MSLRSTPFALEPASQRMARFIAAVPDDRLGRPTPCERYTVGDLLDHISANVLVFIAAATKRPSEGGPSGDAANLGQDWRTRIPRDLAALAEAWGAPDAWTGMTRAAGVDLPAEMAGVVALDELVIHGWDLARALRRPAGYDGPELQAVYDMVHQFRSSGAEGLYGPPVPIPCDALLLDRILGLTGRDPGWEPPR
jgi:uncharacterized protein (TIGR03086 family)